jgi:hypothetical protein
VPLRKNFPYLGWLVGGLCLFLCGWTEVAEGARLELRGRNAGPGGEIRIPLGQTATVDVWMDGEGERIRTLNLFLLFDPAILRPLDSDAEKEDMNPFVTKNYMPQPSESLNGLLAAKGELIYGVTNLANATASGAGVVASFQIEAIGPGPATDVVVDFRFPLNFTSYEVMNDQGGLEKRDFEPSMVRGLHVLIGAGLLVSDIPDLVIPGGGRDRSILLDEYVLDAIYPDAQIEWEVSGANQVKAVIEVDRRLAVEAPDDWSGRESLMLTARSPDGLEDADGIDVTVIGPPRLQEGLFGLPDILMVEDSRHNSFDLDDFLVPDPFNLPDQLSWYASGQRSIHVLIDPLTHGLTIAPPENWIGEETIFFTVSNRFGLADTASVRIEVSPVNDPPLIDALAPLVVKVGEEVEGVLVAGQVSDVDNRFDELAISIAGDARVAAEIRAGRIVVRGLEVGPGRVELIVTDPRGDRATARLEVQVIGDELQPPRIEFLPDLLLQAGDSFLLTLDDFATDLDSPDSLLSWSAVAGEGVEVSIGPGRIAEISAFEEFAGEVEVTFEVRDPEENVDSALILVTVLEKSAAEIDLLLPVEVGLEGGERRVFGLREIVSGGEGDSPDLVWQFSGTQLVVAAIEGDSLVLSVPDVGEGAFESLTVEVVDARGRRDLAEVGIWISPAVGGPVVRPSPTLNITIAGVATIDLDDFFFDLKYRRDEVVWSVVEFSPDLFVTIDQLTHVATLRRVETAGKRAVIAQEAVFGEVIFEARNPEGQTAQLAVRVQLEGDGGGEIFAVDIPDTTMTAGTRLVLDLDPFVGDVDPALLGWQVVGSAPDGFGAVTDAERRSLGLVATGFFTGVVPIELLATGPDGQTGSGRFEVTVVAPDLELRGTDAIQLRAGERDSSLVLDDLVDMGEPAELIWTVEGAAFVGATIEANSRRVEIWSPEGVAGEDILVFTARGMAGETAQIEVRVLVEEVWELGEIPSLSLLPGESTVLELDDFVARGRPERLVWSATGAERVISTLEGDRRRLRLQVPKGQEPGADELILMALTPDGQVLTAAYPIAILASPLRLREMRDLFLVMGQTDSTRVLDDYVESGNPDKVEWSAGGAEELVVQIDPDSRRLQVTAPQGFTGEEWIVFTASFGEERAVRTLRVAVTESPPVLRLASFPDLTLSAGQVDSSLVLDEYVEVGDPAVVQWEAGSGGEVEIEIDAGTRRVRLRALANFEEVELLFTATLDGESASEPLRVRLEAAPVALELASLPEVKILQGTIDSSLVLDRFLVAGDTLAVSWSVRGGGLVKATVDPESHRLLIDAREGRAGIEIFFIDALQEEASASEVLRVVVRAASFSVLSPPSLTIGAEQAEARLALDPLVVGDFPPEQIGWEVDLVGGLNPSIEPTTRTLVLSPDEEYSGASWLALTATFPSGEQRQIALAVEVLAKVEVPPQVDPLPELFGHSGTTIDVLDLDSFSGVEEAGNLLWRVVGEGQISLSIDPLTHILTLSIPADFGGEEVRQLAVRRVDGELESLVSLIVRVPIIAAPPVLRLPAEIVLPVGEAMNLNLAPLVDDPDTDGDFLLWSALGEDGLQAVFGGGNESLTLFSPSFVEAPLSLLLMVTDPEGNRAEGTIQVRLIQIDRTAPNLRLEVRGNQVFGELLDVRVYADEPLARRPTVEVSGERLAVEEEGDHYRAVYLVGLDGLLDIEVSGADAGGNVGIATLQVAVGWLVEGGGTVISPDGKVQLNIPERLSGTGHLALLYGNPSPMGGRVYHADLSGGEEDKQAVELIFRDLAPEELEGRAVLRWDAAAAGWEELPSFVGESSLQASVKELGMFKVGAVVASGPAVVRPHLAYPNPFKAEVTIRYLLHQAGPVRVEIYDAQGRQIRILVDQLQQEGPWTAVWRGKDEAGEAVASGIYLYMVAAKGERHTGKVTLLH